MVNCKRCGINAAEYVIYGTISKRDYNLCKECLDEVTRGAARSAFGEPRPLPTVAAKAKPSVILCGQCRDCRYFDRYTNPGYTNVGDCKLHGPYSIGGSLVTTYAEDEQLEVNEEFGCVQWQDKEVK